MLVVLALYVVNRLLAYFAFLDKRERGFVITNRSVLKGCMRVSEKWSGVTEGRWDKD